MASAVILAILSIAVVLDLRQARWHGLVLLPLAVAFGLAAASEMHALASARGVSPSRAIALLGVLLVMLFASVPMWWKAFGSYPDDCPVGTLGWPLWGLLAACGVVVSSEVFRFRSDDGERIERIVKSVWIVIYPGLLFSFLVLLRQVGTAAWGLTMVVGVVLVPKVGDTGAYFGGRRFGRRKLAPVLSPGKTIEGGVAGVITAMVGAWVYFAWLAPALFGVPGVSGASSWRSLLLGAVVAVVGIDGDLFESLLKRDVQVKDSSGWLPGLGGILDTTDSILFCAPVGYAFCLASWQGLPGV